MSSLCFVFCRVTPVFFFFFFNDTATTEIFTLSLHDALPICFGSIVGRAPEMEKLYRIIAKAAHSSHPVLILGGGGTGKEDRKTTRLNSSHSQISYAAFCLKKKKHENDIGSLHRPVPGCHARL